MAVNPAFTVSVSGRDRSGEPTRYTINRLANYALASYAPGDPVYDFINVQVASVCDGLVVNVGALGSQKLSNAAHSTDGQREEKWLCTYYDNATFALYQIELPCRKSTVKPPFNTDDVDLTVVPWVAFKVGFELTILSPDGNLCTLSKVTLVGRNS